MSFQSVNLLRERVIRAAFECVKELEEREGILHTKGSRGLLRAVKALQAETWRTDEAPAIISELLHLVELQAEPSSMLGVKISKGTQESVLRAKAFLGQREVNDDTQPRDTPRRPRKLRPSARDAGS